MTLDRNQPEAQEVTQQRHLSTGCLVIHCHRCRQYVAINELPAETLWSSSTQLPTSAGSGALARKLSSSSPALRSCVPAQRYLWFHRIYSSAFQQLLSQLLKSSLRSQASSVNALQPEVFSTAQKRQMCLRVNRWSVLASTVDLCNRLNFQREASSSLLLCTIKQVLWPPQALQSEAGSGS